MYFGRSRTRTARTAVFATVALAAAAFLLVPGSHAFAGGTVLNGYIVKITANVEGLGTETWSINVPQNWTFSNEKTWTPGAETIYCGGQAMFDVSDVMVKLNADPAVDLTFAVRNRTSATATFTVNSATVAFDPLVDNWAYATAGVTLTDGNNNGAALAGLQAGGKAYEAKYNGTSVFADLVSGFSGFGTTTNSERKPALPTWSVIIPGSVSTISSQFLFNLSPGDSASGTSSFVVGAVPEPATLVLLALGATAIGTRRRR